MSDEQMTNDLAWSQIARFYFERAATMLPGSARNKETAKAARAIARCCNPLTMKMQILGSVDV